MGYQKQNNSFQPNTTVGTVSALLFTRPVLSTNWNPRDGQQGNVGLMNWIEYLFLAQQVYKFVGLRWNVWLAKLHEFLWKIYSYNNYLSKDVTLASAQVLHAQQCGLLNKMADGPSEIQLVMIFPSKMPLWGLITFIKEQYKERVNNLSTSWGLLVTYC